jgi:hypothetical protein
MDDFHKLAESWRSIRIHGRLDCSFEWAVTMMRYASYGLLTSREPPPTDPRQMELSLQGGGYRRKVIRILAS